MATRPINKDSWTVNDWGRELAQKFNLTEGMIVERVRKMNPTFNRPEEAVSTFLQHTAPVPTCVIRAIMSIVTGIEPVASPDKEDAERWRALMSSQRLHFMGSAGFDNKRPEDDPDTDLLQKLTPVPRPNTYMHFGMEFWSEHPVNKKKFPDDFERKFMVTYVDEMRRRATIPSRAKEIEKLVRENYAEPDTDAADLAAEELRKDPTRDNDEIARHVAQLILQP